MTRWSIEGRAGLAPGTYSEVLRLQAECEAAEGLDLKLELAQDGGGLVENTFLAYEGGRLLGYCGIDVGHDAEVCGMVHPSSRRQGIGTELLRAVVATAAAQGRQNLLVIAEDRSPVALDWMRRRGASLDQVELRMVLGLGGVPASTARRTARLRTATDEDRAALVRLLSAAFANAEEFMTRPRPGLDEETLIAYEGETLIGTTRLVTGPRRSMIYGFVIDSGLRGRGHGGSMMKAVLDRLRDRGVSEVGLEVEPQNSAAVRLYSSFGFRVITTYRYMRLAV